MAKLRMTLIWTGLKEYTKDVRRSETVCRTVGFKKMFQDAAPAVEHVFNETFQNEGPGFKWAALRPYTVKARARRLGYYQPNRTPYMGEGPSHKILHWSHRLWDSMTSNAGGKGIRKFHRFGVTWGTKLKYAPYLHEGSKKMQRRMLFDVIRPDPEWNFLVSWLEHDIDNYLPMMKVI